MNAVGEAYVTGETCSPDFPTVNPFQSNYAGPNYGASCGGGNQGDALVAKLNAAGSALLYSTFLGGSGDDLGWGIALDSAGNAYIAGRTWYSANFPTANPLQAAFGGLMDGFVAKLSPAGNALTFSTYLGGSGDDAANGIALKGSDIFVTGSTSSSSFPTTADALQPLLAGGDDAFLVRISEVITVTIDIKPGSYPNSINLGSGGTVPVAIFSTASFDARTVDPLTVTLASAPVKLKGNGTAMSSFQDVNGDGLQDLVVHLSTETLQLSETDTEAVLEGKTFDGMSIRGTDTVRVVP